MYALLDIRRRLATRSRVTATLTGVAGTGVEAGSLAKTSTDGDQFRTLADVVLSPSGVVVEMEAVESGPIEAPAGTLTVIVTAIAGWETITNAAAATPGINREEDEEFRASAFVRTAHSSSGPLDGIRGALEDALAGRTRVLDNRTKVAKVVQEYTLDPNSVLVIAEKGSDGDIMRAVENHRGMGCGTMAAIRGGMPDETALGMVSNGTVTWGGVSYTGLDLSGATTPVDRAAALTALLVSAGVTVSYIDGAYVAQFGWDPDESPNFGNGTAESAYGLDADSNAYPAGPFYRPRIRELTVAMTLTRRPGFPADGLAQVRGGTRQHPNGVIDRVREYGIGEEVWANDLLTRAERVTGTRITGLTVQYAGADASGVAVPLDAVWNLPNENLTINVA